MTSIFLNSPEFCPLCYSTKIEFQLENKDRRYGTKFKTELFLCLACGLLFASRLKKTKTHNFYPSNYYTHGSVKLSRFPSLVAPQILPFGNWKALDFGCGAGIYLAYLSGWGWKTYGYDPDTRPDDKIWRRKYSLVTMIEVIEHLDNLDKVLKKIRKVLTADGRLVLTTPLLGFNFRLFRENWYPLDSPRHRQIFNQENLTLLLERSGFKVVKIKKADFATAFWDSLNYVFYGRRKDTLWFKIFYFLKLDILSNVFLQPFFNLFGLADKMIVYAEVNSDH